MPEEKQVHTDAEKAEAPVCWWCDVYGRTTRATTAIGGRPACGDCFARQVFDPTQ